jgi:hypothetical protein
MPILPFVCDNLLLGNQAESLVHYLLSKHCLVRNIVGNTDIGIDLFCEAIIDNKPFVHFCAQVKCSNSIPDKKVVRGVPFTFEMKHLNYWKQQPVPVFAFLVPKVNNPKYIHVIDISQRLIEFSASKKTPHTLYSYPDLIVDMSKGIEKVHHGIDSFIRSHIPWVCSAIYASKGMLLPSPDIRKNKIKYYAIKYLASHFDIFKENVMTTSCFTLQALLESGKTKDIELCMKIVDIFNNSYTYLPHFVKALYLEEKGNFNDSICELKDSLRYLPKSKEFIEIRNKIGIRRKKLEKKRGSSH